MPDNRNHKCPIQIKFFVDETELGLIKARMAQLGIENMTSYLRRISASIHSRGRTAKSGTGVTEITPVPQNLNFAFFDKRQETRGLSVSFSFALTSRTSSCPATP